MSEKAAGAVGEAKTYPVRDGAVIPILYYRSAEVNAPLLLDIHGGGFISGDHHSDDGLNRLLNKRSGFSIASVGYRCAPQAIYPTATHDCLDVLEALIADNSLDFDRSRIFLSGHSAGGNLAAGVSILATGNLRICGQILDYPLLDAYIDPGRRERIPYSIPPFIMRRYNRAYFPDILSRREALASPVYMSDKQAARMPPTLIITCGRDSLRGDGRRYFELLSRNGVPVKLREYAKAVHGFTEIVPSGGIDDCWWLGKKIKSIQKELFRNVLDEMYSFLVESAQTGGREQEKLPPE